jgi:hypothetical protein
LFLLSIALGIVSVAQAADAARLIPAPGTGHGVLTGTPPDEDASALAYGPGFGGTCAGPQDPETLFVWGYGFGSLEHYTVGSPMYVCIGRFPSRNVDVSITPPVGEPIALPTQTFVAKQQSIILAVSVLPSPPRTRYQITSNRSGLDVRGTLSGDGSGSYTVQASSGGVEKNDTFTLDVAPSPRVLVPDDLVAPGGRVELDIAGVRPFKAFRVSVFGPFTDAPTGPLRTTIIGRGNKRGEAVVTLDVQAGSDIGLYCVVLGQAPEGRGCGSRVAVIAGFDVTTPNTSVPPPRPYRVTDDVNLRAEPTSSSTSLAVIPSGTSVVVECVTNGESIDGPNGSTDKWDRVTWEGSTGYVTDQYVDTGDAVNAPTIIRPC